ncbi:phosphate ABC transporter permease subunit PstC [Oricola thermophila]|uniref:Phosphate transport system permease protein n=1 Tax=Oricola thermophila TaxID=2742145 RepID=A0A6N1VJ15_9HYPH|nr:phosphate ABC transporter permease subunit PstC [Oricola thermophila]QKV19372.1 phosphate ABC transporter permease subunit PstC [Oricola thermophila]
MPVYALLFIVLAAAFVAYLSYGRARTRFAGDGEKPHSRPIYHALNAAIWTGIPSFIFLLLWLLFNDNIVSWIVVSQVPGVESLDASARSLLRSEIGQVASGRTFTDPTPDVIAAAERLHSLRYISGALLAVVVAALSVFGAFIAMRMIARRTRARHKVENAATWFMLFASAVAILTTVGIIASLVYEAVAFFSKVPFTEFFFGTRWEPQIPLRADQVAGQGAFGMVPVLFGTMAISFLAMVVAVPVGIMSAIYLTEYAGSRFRSIVKPLLEILAGIPTVVYGFFAVLTVAPLIRALGLNLGIPSAPNSALAAGGVMGIMLIPFISSISDDALAAVPRAMRDGSYALGATKGETIRKVLLPAALPGIVGGILLALSRAIGETMIVVMAAGLIAKMTINPFESVTTVTVQIVTLLIGDTEFDNPKTLAAFALGLLLFVITLGLNLIALNVVRRYREKY